MPPETSKDTVASCPAELDDAIQRITLAPTVAAGPPDRLTGELANLALWWARVSGGMRPVARNVCATDPNWAGVAEAASAGVVSADAAIDAGATLLVPRVARRQDTEARTIVAVLARAEPQDIVAQPPGYPDRDWMDRVAGIRREAHRATVDGVAAWQVLVDLDARDIAYCVAVLLTAAARRTACIVDGTDECAAALVADRLSAQAGSWWIAGSQSADPARHAVSERVPLTQGLPLSLTDDSGLGAESTIALLDLVTRD